MRRRIVLMVAGGGAFAASLSAPAIGAEPEPAVASPSAERGDRVVDAGTAGAARKHLGRAPAVSAG